MRPTVIVPAMGVPARHYATLEEALRERGFTPATVPLPGDEAAPPSGEQAGYHGIVTGVLADTVAAARDAGGGEPAVLVGHSLGGQLAVMYAATHPDEVAGVALPAAGTVHWRSVPTPWNLAFLATTQLADLLGRTLGHFPGHRLGFGGRQHGNLIRDWARLGRTGRLRPDGARDAYEPRLPDVRVPVVAITVPGDTYAPASSADALLAKLPNAATERVELGVEVFSRPVDHLRWLRDPAPVADVIADRLGRGTRT